MAAIKPTVYPDFCVNTNGTDHNVVDSTTGENNVVAPDAGKKLNGFLYNEKPPRQHFNWLYRIITQWVRWLDELTATHTINIGYNADNINTAVSDAGFTPNISDSSLLSSAISAGGLPKGYINGLHIGVPAAALTSVEIGDGIARCYNNSATIALSALLTKDAASNWAAGDGNGGFPSGLTIANNTYYNVFVIKNPTTGVVDAGFDRELDASNLLADASGFTKYRRVGTLLWKTTNFDRINRVVNTDIYLLDTRRSETLNLSSVSGNFLTSSILAPDKMNCELIIGAEAPTYDGAYAILTDAVGDYGSASESYHDIGSNGSSVKTSVYKKRIVNKVGSNSGLIRHIFSTTTVASGTVDVHLYGWVDKRDDI